MAKGIKKQKKTNKLKTNTVTELGSDIINDLNNKVKTTKQDLQKQVDDLTKQLNELRQESSKPAKKWFKKIEKKYQKKFEKQQKKIEKRSAELLASKDKLIQQLKDELVSKVPIADKLMSRKKTSRKPAAKNIKAPMTKTKTPVRRKTTTNTAQGNELTQIKGAGPTSIKKLNEAGIKSLQDLVNATPQQLEAIKSMRGSATWVNQAKAILKK